MQNLKVSLVQTIIHWESPKDNLDHFSKKIRAIEEETDLIVLPEVFSTGFTMEPQGVAEPMEGPSMKWMHDMARHKGCVVCGSLAIEGQGRYYNRFVWMRPDGTYETYDKKHLFTYAGEQKAYTPGSKPLIVELNGWKIRPLICYDLRFPVWSRNRVQDDVFQYDCLLYVANWPETRSHAWRVMLMARAIENQCFVIGVNRIGEDGRGIQYSGDSTLLSPLGENYSDILPNQDKTETIVMTRCPLDGFRRDFRAWADWDDFSVK